MGTSEKRERFEKVASNRVQRIIDTLNLLKNCSNQSNYEYSADDVELMFTSINKAMRDAKAAFINEMESTEKKGFSFNNK